jgi:Flp pilus assembly pilin Flp
MRIGIRKKGNAGQNLIEYAVLLGIVTVALVSMRAYFQRGTQSVIKVVADDYSNKTQGEPIDVVEKRIKTQMGPEWGTATTDITASLTQKTINKGESNIRTETSGSTVVAGTSKSTSGDYRNKDRE